MNTEAKLAGLEALVTLLLVSEFRAKLRGSQFAELSGVAGELAKSAAAKGSTLEAQEAAAEYSRGTLMRAHLLSNGKDGELAQRLLGLIAEGKLP